MNLIRMAPYIDAPAAETSEKSTMAFHFDRSGAEGKPRVSIAYKNEVYALKARVWPVLLAQVQRWVPSINALAVCQNATDSYPPGKAITLRVVHDSELQGGLKRALQNSNDQKMRCLLCC
jgi:hypothetical protein